MNKGRVTMGILDDVTSLLGNAGGQAGGVLGAVQALISEQGGLQGLVQKLQSGGLGEQVKSWIGSGQNLPISAEQIQQVLGSPQVAAIAGKLGIDPQQAAAQVAQFLPGLIDKLTPNGQLPEGGNLLAQGADLLKGFLNR
ncbi:YidB family protein [Amnimonas aquatica]|nr:YidB family protein [Amnimonas aquatica]